MLLFYHYKITLNYATTHEELKGVFNGFKYHPFHEMSIFKNFKNRIISIKISKVPLFQPTAEAKTNGTNSNIDKGG